jgi:hypothetical protein
MPDPVEGFKNLLKDKKIAIKFYYIEQFEKCFLRWKKYLISLFYLKITPNRIKINLETYF